MSTPFTLKYCCYKNVLIALAIKSVARDNLSTNLLNFSLKEIEKIVNEKLDLNKDHSKAFDKKIMILADELEKNIDSKKKSSKFFDNKKKTISDTLNNDDDNDDDDDEEDDETSDSKKTISKISVKYGSRLKYSAEEENMLAEGFYSSSVGVSYKALMYENKEGMEQNDKYSTGIEISDVESDMISMPEAESTFKEMQLAAVEGTLVRFNNDKKRKFDIWIKFNSAEFRLFQTLYSFTSDVNYAPL